MCRRCDAGLAALPSGACTLCQEHAALPGTLRCGGCARLPSPLNACLAWGAYEGAVLDLVQRAKYPARGLRGLDPGPLALLADRTVQAAARLPGARPGLLIPIPLHPRRLRRRGFNPAERLARRVARAHRTACDPVALVRIRDTDTQTGLGRAARRRNVAGAFRLGRRSPLPDCVWLVDDVVTTRATLEAAARVLRRAGVGRVAAVCAARSVRL